MSRLLGLATLLVITAAGLPAVAEVVSQRVVLPANGIPVDLAPLLGSGSGHVPVRIVITGTLSSSLDGSEIDAMGRRVGERFIEAEGPFVRLPPGARLIESDPEIHRYLFEVPRQTPLPVALHLAPLAARHLVTLSELEQRCTGAFEVELLETAPSSVTMSDSIHPAPAPPALLTASRPPAPPLSRWTLTEPGLVAQFGAGVAFLLLLGALALHQRTRKSVATDLMRRCRVASRTVEREARALGPAFDHVIAASVRLVETALQAKDHLNAARSALHRTESLRADGARTTRGQLLEQQRRALGCMKGIAERLEETAAGLAVYRADQAQVLDADDLVGALDAELETAVTATREAGFGG